MKGYTLQKRKTKDGRTRWTAQVRVHGHHSSKTFGTKSEAEEWAIEEARRLKGGGLPSKEKLSQLVDAYCEDETEGLGSISERDHSRRQNKLTWWIDQLGDVRVRDLSHLRIREIHRAKGKETTPATANRYLAALSAVLRYALEEGLIDGNPCSKISRLEEDNGRLRYLSNARYESHVKEPDEYSRLLRACKEEGPRLHAMVRFSVETGARLSETEGLTWEHVRKIGDRWSVTFEETKNDRPRTVGISDEILKMMRALPRRMDGRVFGNRPRRAWRRALKKAEIEDFRWHDLRHTCASYLAMEGRTRAEIAAQLGHKTLTQTDKYSHLGPSHVLSVTESMAGKL